jgi:ACS family tartrate transporter-like MFS transporter
LPVTFYTLRLLLGTAESGFFPGVILYLTYWFPSEERARILGAFMTALPLSTVIGAPVSAALLDLNGGGLRGWQWLFLLEGLPTVAAGVVGLRFLTDRPESAKWLAPEERADLLRRLRVPEVAEIPAGGVPATALRTLLHPALLTMSAVYLALLIALYGYSFWLPQIILGLCPPRD